jgi:hypothetical protein
VLSSFAAVPELTASRSEDCFRERSRLRQPQYHKGALRRRCGGLARMGESLRASSGRPSLGPHFLIPRSLAWPSVREVVPKGVRRESR